MHTRLKETQDRLVREGKAGGAGSKRQVVDNDGAVMEGEGTSDSGSDEDMDEDGGESEKEPRGPIIDDDGFELVQRKGRRR